MDDRERLEGDRGEIEKVGERKLRGGKREFNWEERIAYKPPSSVLDDIFVVAVDPKWDWFWFGFGFSWQIFVVHHELWMSMRSFLGQITAESVVV